MAETRNAGDSVRFVRTIALLTNNLVLIVDQATAEGRVPMKTLDIAYQATGKPSEFSGATAWSPPANNAGYAVLKNPVMVHGQRPPAFTSVLPSGRTVVVTVADNAPTDLITATAPTVGGQQVSTLLFRRTNIRSTVVAWCISLDGTPADVRVHKAPAPRTMVPGAATPVAVSVKATDKTQWEVLIDPDQVQETNGVLTQRSRFTIR